MFLGTYKVGKCTPLFRRKLLKFVLLIFFYYEGFSKRFSFSILNCPFEGSMAPKDRALFVNF